MKDPPIPEVAKTLSPKARRFCQIFAAGGVGKAEAAKAAGFSKTGNSAAVRASNILRDPRAQAYIKLLVEERQSLAGAMAASTVEQVVSGEFDDKVQAGKLRLDAPKFALGAAGLGSIARSESHVQIEHKDSPADKVKAIAAMITTLNNLGIKIDLDTMLPQGLRKLAGPDDP